MILDFPSNYFSKKLSKKYGYDEFIVRRWIAIFDDAEELIKGMENVPKYIRVNTIKIREEELVNRMEKRGFILRKTDIQYCYEVVHEPYSIGSTPEYLMGYYYVMDKSSCIPPLVFLDELKNNTIIADFASAPGGKTTMLSQIMKDKRIKGSIIAIEAQKDRISALIDNIHRMGVTNVAVLNMDARAFPKHNLKVDGVLLDAPCTGEGIIHKDKSRKKSRGKEDIEFCSKLQKELLKAAIESVKIGGIIVYSTCSLTPEENEFVIQWAIENFPVKVEKIKLPGEKGLVEIGNLKLDDSIKLTKRYYPHKNRCSGFFVAKLRRV